jgi:hypothetical protein
VDAEWTRCSPPYVFRISRADTGPRRAGGGGPGPPDAGELLSGESVWQALEALDAIVATVPFSGRAGGGGRTDRIVLSRVERVAELVATGFIHRCRGSLQADRWSVFTQVQRGL